MKQRKPTEEWLRIAAEARPHLPTPPPDEAAPAWFVTRALAARRATRAQRTAAAAPWFAFPGMARAATASIVLAAACAVLVFSSVSLEDFTDPLLPELEELDLP